MGLIQSGRLKRSCNKWISDLSRQPYSTSQSIGMHSLRWCQSLNKSQCCTCHRTPTDLLLSARLILDWPALLRVVSMQWIASAYPSFDDKRGLYDYYKRVFNSDAGASTYTKWCEAWRKHGLDEVEL